PLGAPVADRRVSREKCERRRRLAADGLERIHVVGACAVFVRLGVDERDPLLLRIERNEVRDLLRVIVAYDQRICAEPQAEFLPAGAQGGRVGGLADAIDRAEDGFSAPSRWVRKEALALLALRLLSLALLQVSDGELVDRSRSCVPRIGRLA